MSFFFFFICSKIESPLQTILITGVFVNLPHRMYTLLIPCTMYMMLRFFILYLYHPYSNKLFPVLHHTRPGYWIPMWRSHISLVIKCKTPNQCLTWRILLASLTLSYSLSYYYNMCNIQSHFLSKPNLTSFINTISNIYIKTLINS